MIEIVAADTVLPPLAGYAALAFTSANGVRAFSRLSPERQVKVYAVGPGTAAALRATGFADIRTGSGNAADLAALIRSELRPGARMLHAAGEYRRGRFGRIAARAGGIDVDRAVLYDAAAAAQLSRTAWPNRCTHVP